jgi:single-stranded DNA-binding protein
MVKTIVNGFLIADADIHVLEGGNRIANLAISARSENPKASKAAPHERQIWNVSVYLTTQNKLGDYLKKGTNVLVSGKQWVEVYKEKNYVKISAAASDIELLPKGEKKPAGKAAEGSAEEVPEENWGGEGEGK